jgi:transcriptional regulator with XRE-family HTH domain
MSENFSDQMRRTIEESGITRYQLSCKTGVDQSALSRFVKGQRGLQLDAIDRIAEVLGWSLSVEPKSKATEAERGEI